MDGKAARITEKWNGNLLAEISLADAAAADRALQPAQRFAIIWLGDDAVDFSCAGIEVVAAAHMHRNG